MANVEECFEMLGELRRRLAEIGTDANVGRLHYDLSVALKSVSEDPVERRWHAAEPVTMEGATRDELVAWARYLDRKLGATGSEYDDAPLSDSVVYSDCCAMWEELMMVDELNG